MPAKVILTVTQGKLVGRTLVFEERTTCIIGRAEDCAPRVPDDKHHITISRHHCLLDINPPNIRIRDFGSLNGTYVNGTKIGQRGIGQTPEDAIIKNAFPERDLDEGDKIKLGDTVLRVSLFIPTLCAECSTEIPDDQKVRSLRSPEVYQCEACRRKAERAYHREPPKAKSKMCVGCGKDVTREIGKHQQGEFLCKECRANPERLLQHLLELASQGNQSLKALQGYSQQEQLGKGGMGAVYLVQNNQTGEQVALKLMLPQIAVGEQAKAQFQREAENTRALKHRHVVELRETGCVNGIFFFTLEYCEGRSVGEMIKERGGMLPVGEACKLIIQALEGLQYSHTAAIPYIKRQDGTYAPGHGLVHRDIKPANLFLVRGGKSHIVKIGDYGLAKAFELAGLSGQTRTGDVSGTPAFMTREQVTNFRYAKPEVDVWAMAASLYFMVTGMVPRDFPRGRDPWLTVLETNAVPILQRNAAIPKRLAEVIDYALVDNPQIGFKTAIEFKQALESVL